MIAAVSIETHSSEHIQKLMSKGLPVVLFDRVLNDLATSKVVQDDYKGASNATVHLIQQGCKRIAHLAGPKNLENAKRRAQGYCGALTENGMKIKKNLIVYSGFSQEDGLRDMSKLLGLKPVLDAVFAVNDRKAIGAMLALRRYGYKVPDHVAIISFGNTLVSEVMTPTLSTVEQAAYEIGAKSCQLLFGHIKTPNIAPQTVVMPSKLVIRESSAKPKIG